MDRRRRVVLAIVLVALAVCLAVGVALTFRVDHPDDEDGPSGGSRSVTSEVVAHRGQQAIAELRRAP